MTTTIQAHGKRYVVEDGPGRAAEIVRKRGEPYERFLLEYIYDLQLHGVAVDVGANIGNHALWFAHVCDFDQVIAFEPVREYYEALWRNVVANEAQYTIEMHTVALGDSAHGAHLAGPHGQLAPDGEIIVVPLDSYQLERVSLIKIDVEGMEAEVIRGARQTIEEDRPVVFAEEWDDDPRWHDDIAAELEPLGYRMTYRFDTPQAWTPVGKWEHMG